MDTTLKTFSQQNNSCPQSHTSWYCDKDWTGTCFPTRPGQLTQNNFGSSVESTRTTPYSMVMCQDDKGCKMTVCPNESSQSNCPTQTIKKGESILAFGNCGPVDQINTNNIPGPFFSSLNTFDQYQCVTDGNLPTSITNVNANLTSYYVCDADKCTLKQASPADFQASCNESYPPTPPTSPSKPTEYCPTCQKCPNTPNNTNCSKYSNELKKTKQDITGLTIGLICGIIALIIFIVLYTMTLKQKRKRS